MGFTYRGVPTFKNPFDLALYQLLLWECRPRTIFEIGSKFGGSALWFSDLLRTFGVDFNIQSVDIKPPETEAPEGVTFHRGDGLDLGPVLTAALLEALPRPFLVIEDADHRLETTLAVLRFFDPWLHAGEYIVVEDGIVDDLFDAARLEALGGGPRVAISRFLSERGDAYEIDARYCDHFGRNMTWNVNGYLRRVG
jgi:cephalosporin hydroxylase